MNGFDDNDDEGGERVEFTRVPTASHQVQPFDFASGLRARAEASLGLDLSEISSLDEVSIANEIELMLDEARRQASREHERALDALRRDHVAQLSAFLMELDVAYRRATALAHESALALGALIAQVLVEEAALAQPEIHLTLTRAALRRAIGLGDLSLRVHPSAVATLLEASAGLGAQVGAEVSVVADERLSPGDVLIEGHAGHLDATIRARIGALVDQARRRRSTQEAP